MSPCLPCIAVVERGAHAIYNLVAELPDEELPPVPAGVESWHAVAVASVKLVAHLRRRQAVRESL